MKKLSLLLLLLLPACHHDEVVSNKYSSLPARFTFTPVNSISQLLTACNSMGQWCAIYPDMTNRIVHFALADGKNPGQANLTAVDGYTGFNWGTGNGYLVGLPNVPEVGETEAVVTCFDRSCRNCYEEATVTRTLELREAGQAYCARCQRTYNLNNSGIVASGKAGNPLYRYRVYYGNNTLSINNQ